MLQHCPVGDPSDTPKAIYCHPDFSHPDIIYLLMCKNIEFQHALSSNSSDIVIFGNLKLVTGYWLLVTGCWLLVAGCWLLAAGYWLLVGKA
jgi:hypothetical protein